MICPFRRINQNVNGEDIKIGEEKKPVMSKESADCQKRKCPYYRFRYPDYCEKVIEYFNQLIESKKHGRDEND